MESITVDIHTSLIEKCRNNDRSAQFEIYKLYSKAMFNTALRILGDEADAEDVLQEAFVSAFQNLKSYRGESTFGAWLKRIVVNNALNHLKKNKRNLMLVEDIKKEEKGHEWMEDPDPGYSVAAIKTAMEKLPSGFKLVLSLYLFEGYDHREISQILNITESTSKTQYKRAKDKLKAILKQEVNYG